jgi:hypothetical protein
MPTLTTSCPEAPGLAVRLRNWAAGYLPVSAGVELLIAHDYWLNEPGFVATCVDVFEALDDVDDTDATTPMATVLWKRVPGFLAADSSPGRARRVLRAAAELSGVDTATPLCDLVANLPDEITALVLDAIAHQVRWPRRRHSHVATGALAPDAAAVTTDRRSAWGAVHGELRGRLQAWNTVHPADEAAVQLLVAHHEWLTRSDFLAACVQWFVFPDHTETQVPMALISWELVPEFLAFPDVRHTPGNGAILALAAELAGVDTATPLAELFADLDDTDVARVLDAIARIAGWDQSGRTHTVTGRFGHEAST